MGKYGYTLREIRTGKGYSQKQISLGICTQGNYSKFELGENKDLKLSFMEQFLNRLDVSLEEFKYINNGYEFPLREKIIYQFYTQTYNKLENLIELKSMCKLYFKKFSNDKFIGHIHTVLEGLTVLIESNSSEEAILIVSPIWEELSKRDTLYLSDIFLMNAILFIFSLETATEMKNFAFRHIEKYKEFHNINLLKVNLLVNLSLLNMKEKNYISALQLIDEAIEICKFEQKFINLSICYIRKGICLNNLNRDGLTLINKGMKILNVLEQLYLIKVLEGEVNLYSK